ncbi:MAG: type II toxin-antitoxin system RelE/ParE family toxin [Syntrophobacterales bacterium]|nr:type II toxin-antitoxin system RelE/ParE family toxin [Syntrophobacterales bacterium]
MWKILQTKQFGEWFAGSDNVDEDVRESIYALMEVLKSIGPNLGRPYVDSVKGSRHENMKELRVQSEGRPFRIFFAFDPFRQAVLLIGGNKTGDKRFYARMLPIADALYDHYLQDLGERK